MSNLLLPNVAVDVPADGLSIGDASAATGVSIPGLADGDAEELRDRLVELAESRRAGL